MQLLTINNMKMFHRGNAISSLPESQKS